MFRREMAILALLGASACSRNEAQAPHPTSSTAQMNATDQQESRQSQLEIEDLKVGTGKTVDAGRTVVVRYTARIKGGAIFESTEGRAPAAFELDRGQMIPGWELGLRGMKVGGKRRFTVPPQLGFGHEGIPGKVPADASLVFEVELLDLK